ncbi:MAG: hypothetical protein II108_04770 [Clostridiales bacterium]|nr:hypothetical protein [Clostridiales bacterium]
MRLTLNNHAHLRRAAGAFACLMCLILIPMVSLAAGTGMSAEADASHFATDLAFYAGAFSTAVTASINPSATMAVLAILGAIENAAIYQPDSAVLCSIADFLNGVPILREVGKLPIANPYAAVFLTLIAAALIIIHSFAESKFVSEETIDKLDKLIGYICTVSISLLPFVTNDALEADPPVIKGAALTRSAGFFSNAPAGTHGPGTYILAGITVIAITVFYYCIYSCVDNWEVIVAAFPMKGTSLIWQIVKALIHALLLVLQIFAPVISFIISIHLAVAGLFLFRILKRNSQYYKDVYVFTILRKIFKRNDEIPKIEKHVPRKLKKLYPGMELCMSVYTFHGIGRLPKRSRVWLIKEDGKLDIVYKRLIRKPYIVSWSDLRTQHEGKQFYLETCARFLKIRTEDRKFEAVMSTRYKPETEMLSELLDLKDFEPVKQEIKETKKLKRRMKHKIAAAESV